MNIQEPYIAHLLRKYLSRVGHRSNPVLVTERQCKQLARAQLLHVDTLGITRFEGQLVAIIGENHVQRDMRSCARVIERINRA